MPAREGSFPFDLPPSRSLASLSFEACVETLEKTGTAFSLADAAEGEALVKLEGKVGGIEIRFVGKSSTHALLDCRLALALHRWASVLHPLGVRRIEHLSAFRPAARVRGSTKKSGHATGRALDLASLVFESGETIEVLRDWSDRRRGASPCPPREEEIGAAKTLRELVCAAVEAELFQVVITPHHDEAHADHVHLELVPDVDWTYVR